MRPVWHCWNLPCAIPPSQLFNHLKTSPHRVRKGFLTSPSWWTSERKTKTVCAIHFRSAGPLFQNSPLSPGSYVADAEAFEPSKAVTRSGSTPMVGSLMHGSSTNAWFATKPGTARFLNAGIFAISIPLCSKHCRQTFNLEALRRRCQRVEEFPEFEVRKELLRDAPDWEHLQIELAVPFPTSTRLDRLLASELGISRTQLSALHQSALLRTNPDRPDILRRRIRTGIRVIVNRSRLA
jgi:hypothetical protein